MRRAEEHFAFSFRSFVLLISREALAELRVDFRQFMNGAVQHDWQSSLGQSAQNLLALPKRVTKKDCRLVVIQGFLAKTNHTLQHSLRGRKFVTGLSEGRFHDQNIGRPWFAWLSRKASAQLEIPRVKQRLATCFD